MNRKKILKGNWQAKSLVLLLLFLGLATPFTNAQVILEDSFEGDVLNSDIWGVTWWTPHGQLDQGIEPEIVTSPVRYGNHSIKVRAQYNWNDIIDYERTELTGKRKDNGNHHTFFYPGHEYWIGFSVYLPSDWQVDNKSEELVFQLHGNEGDRSPSMSLIIDGEEWYWHIQWGAIPNDPGIDGKMTLWKDNYEKGEWVDWVIHAKFSYSDDGYGFLEYWKNGESVVTHYGPNCYNDDQKIRGPQTGVYKWNWGSGSDFVATERIVYLDEYTVCGENGSYVRVAPGKVVGADFSYEMQECSSEVIFTNKSAASDGDIDYYSWDFGDGETSSAESPTHTYTQPGSYNIQLVAVQDDLSDTIVKKVNVYFSPVPTDVTGTLNGDGTVSLSAKGTGTINWYDVETEGEIIGTGESFIADKTATGKFYAENVVGGQALYTGGNTDKGTGNYYKWDDFEAMWGVQFDAKTDMLLKSVKVYNGESENGSYNGERLIVVMNAGGDTIASAIVEVEQGEQRIPLNMTIPAGTNYRLISDSHVGFWRTTEGASYPYKVGNVVTITADCRFDGLINTDGYHFFYDWEVEVDLPYCSSERVLAVDYSVVDEAGLQIITVYPNPATNYLVVGNFPETDQDYTVCLYNGHMQQVKMVTNKNESSIKIDIEALPSGVYYCKVSTQNNVLVVKKIVIVN